MTYCEGVSDCAWIPLQVLSPTIEECAGNGVAVTAVVATTGVAASPAKLAAERVPRVVAADFAARALGSHNHSRSVGMVQVKVQATGSSGISPPVVSAIGKSASAAASGLPSASHWGGGRSKQPLMESRTAPHVSAASSAREPDHLSTWSPAMQVSGQGWALESKPVASSFAPAASHAVPALEVQGVSISASEAFGQLPPPDSCAGGNVDGSMVPADSSPARSALMPSRRLASEAESELDDELMASLIPDLGIGLPPSRDSLTAAAAVAENALVGSLHARGPSWAGSKGSESSTAEESSPQHFPMRAGHPVCDFYLKTGHCKVWILSIRSTCSGL